MKVKAYLTNFLISGFAFKQCLVFGAILSTRAKVYAHQPPVNTRNMASGTDGKPSMKKEASQTMRQLDQKKGGKGETETFPTTLEGFKYSFNEKGQMRHLETGGPFEFNVSDNRSYNQKHYEALGEVITEKVYELLETEGKLKKHYIPVNSKKTEPCSFIFMSEDALTNENKLLVLIHGSGVVRAGQWTRKLIINENLDKGTQLPYIRRGMEEGYGVIVLNTNLNTVTVNGKEKQIRGSEDPEAHGIYVWKNFIQKSKAKHIAIVGHSYGGVVTAAMAREFLKDFQERVFAIGFTDSVHSVMFSDSKVGKLFQERAVNWVTSNEPLDTPMRTRKNDAKRVSAGHEVHEWTSWSAFESVFEFFNKQYNRCFGETSTNDSSEQRENQPELEVAEEAAEDKDEVMDTSSQGDEKEVEQMKDSGEHEEENEKAENVSGGEDHNAESKADPKSEL